MPSISECDEQIKQQEQVLTSMQHIKEVILNQQKALQEQRHRVLVHENGYGGKGSGTANGSGEAEFAEDFGEDGKTEGGFAGGDAKKRRGVSRHGWP